MSYVKHLVVAFCPRKLEGVAEVAVISESVLRCSAFRLSWQGVFPFLRDVMAAIFSLWWCNVYVMFYARILYTTSDVGGCLFRRSLKC